MKPAIAALSVLLLSFLAFSPLALAANTITVTTDKPSYSGSDTITISGTATPAPGPGFNAFVTVTNPSGSIVYAQSVPVGATTGQFSTSFAAGGSAAWITGTYTVTVTLQGYSPGSTTFQYTAPSPPTGAAQLLVQVGATTPVYAGQQVQVMALVSWSNGTLAQSFVKVSAHYHDPSGTPHQLGAGMLMARGMYMWTISLPSNAADGLYFVMVYANSSSAAGWGAAGFTVNSQIASNSNLMSLGTNVTKGFASITSALSSMQTSLASLGTNVTKGFASIQSALSSMQQTLNSVNTAVGQLQTSASSLATTLGNIQTSLQGLTNTAQSLSSQIATIGNKVDNAATQASNAASAVGTTQLYVLIVAVLAAITLVLELAILIRKLS